MPSTVYTRTNVADVGLMALYLVCETKVAGTNKKITMFLDGGSNASYITTRCANRVNLNKVEQVLLDITTVGGEQTEYDSTIYEVPLRTKNGQVTKVLAYSIKWITGPHSQIEDKLIQTLFPNFDYKAISSRSTTVNLLIGTDY